MAKDKQSKARTGGAKAAARKTPARPAASKPGARPAPAKASAKSTPKPAAKPAPSSPAKAVPNGNAGKPSPTPGKPSPTMTSRKPVAGQPASGKTVPATPAARRTLIARPAPRPAEPELPRLKKSPYTKKELQPMRGALLELRARLQGAMDKLGNEALRADEPDTDSEDVADHGSDAFERNMTLGLLENEARTLQQIDEALTHMEGGRYGVCTACGQAIPLARLEALPFATTCVPCKEKQERRG